MPAQSGFRQLFDFRKRFLKIVFAEVPLAGSVCFGDARGRLLLADSDDHDSFVRTSGSLECRRDPALNICQMVRDLSHALLADVGYTIDASR